MTRVRILSSFNRLKMGLQKIPAASFKIPSAQSLKQEFFAAAGPTILPLKRHPSSADTFYGTSASRFLRLYGPQIYDGTPDIFWLFGSFYFFIF